MGALHPGQRLDGTSYQVVREIGAGGMGVVYEVEHVRLKKRYVAKVIHDQLKNEEGALARMEREAKVLAEIGQHPNIVQVHDLGQTSDGVPYFVMEKLEGLDLRRTIKKRGVPRARAVEIMTDVLDALDYVHKRGVVHRDIKPENIFLAEMPHGTVTKVLDFGIVHVVDGDGRISHHRITKTGGFVGTLYYAAPEQMQGKPAGPANDVYAAGLVLFELLVGKGPFDDDPGVGLSRCFKAAPRLADLVRVPAELSDLLARALDQAPEARPSAGQLVADLRAVTAMLRERPELAMDDPVSAEVADLLRHMPILSVEKSELRLPSSLVAGADANEDAAPDAAKLAAPGAPSDSAARAGGKEGKESASPPAALPTLASPGGEGPPGDAAREAGAPVPASVAPVVLTAASPDGSSPPVAADDAASAKSAEVPTTGAGPGAEHLTAAAPPSSDAPEDAPRRFDTSPGLYATVDETAGPRPAPDRSRGKLVLAAAGAAATAMLLLAGGLAYRLANREEGTKPEPTLAAEAPSQAQAPAPSAPPSRLPAEPSAGSDSKPAGTQVTSTTAAAAVAEVRPGSEEGEPPPSEAAPRPSAAREGVPIAAPRAVATPATPPSPPKAARPPAGIARPPASAKGAEKDGYFKDL